MGKKNEIVKISKFGSLKYLKSFESSTSTIWLSLIIDKTPVMDNRHWMNIVPGHVLSIFLNGETFIFVFVFKFKPLSW